MSRKNAPSKVIRECDLLLEGELIKTQEELNRWLIVQVKKLAQGSAARKAEHRNLQHKVVGVQRFAKGGL